MLTQRTADSVKGPAGAGSSDRTVASQFPEQSITRGDAIAGKAKTNPIAAKVDNFNIFGSNIA